MKMIFNQNAKKIGFAYTILIGVFSLFMGIYFFEFPRLQPAYFDAGVDVMGALICAVLFYGCMSQHDTGSSAFRTLTIQVSTAFAVNLCMYFFYGVPEWNRVFFFFCLAAKLIDLFMIFFFFQYVRRTLGFTGKIVSWMDKGVPIMLACQILVLMINVFYPLTFTVDSAGVYSSLDLSFLEDIYLAVVSLITAILIIRCDSPKRQKSVALSFIIIPVIFYILTGGAFGYATQYGAILLSLLLMYCVIFNDKSSKLTATQTELNMATQIQAGMLPSIFPAFPNREEFDLYASMDPAKEVGGDFYDFFMVDDDHLGVVIADVSGKGVPAALFMMIAKTIIQNYAKMGLSAAETLTKANAALCADNKMEMFVTTWCGVLELSSGIMDCASAGHEYPALCHEGKFELFKDKHGFVLGGMDGMKYKGYELKLEKDDKLFVYTDGVPEATNTDSELFGTDRMIEALNRNPSGSPREIMKTVRSAVDDFVGGAEQFDDLTMVCLEYRGRNSSTSAEE